MRSLKYLENCEFCVNGEEALNAALREIKSAIAEHTLRTPEPPGQKVTLQPINLMLLDFQMPRLNGIQVVEKVRAYCLQQNEEYMEQNIEIFEPRYVFLTAFLTKAFKSHLSKLQVTESFEKPLQTKTLAKILHIDDQKDEAQSDDE